ncbi:MAG: cytochrome P450 [Verrucomicrobiota bacterium]
MNSPDDPFEEKRNDSGILRCPFQGEEVPMILRHADIKEAAKDWKTFSSDAPFRVPIPSEENFRKMRQLPIEVDPPEHKPYRKIIEPYFKRAKNPEVVEKAETLVDRMVRESLELDSIEIVREFALPLQSHALTYLLNVDEAEAETWISWGIHVFRDGESGEMKGETLDRYLNERIDQAIEKPRDDFFTALTKATFQDRPLTKDEMLGFANLTFAGGRDTIIHTISSIFAYFAGHPEAFDFLRTDPRLVMKASEEFFRVISPLTHIGRVCPEETEVHGSTVAPEGRISLCWASANQDEAAFESPSEIRLDRKPNPHLAFGAGPHVCLGALHARLVVRTLLTKLCLHLSAVEILDAKENIETEAEYQRTVGYESLHVRLHGLNP